MIRKFIFVTVILTILVYSSEVQATEFEEWRNDKPCGQRLADPVQTTITGCELAFCVNVPDAAQICVCLPSKESDHAQMIYRKNGTVILQWDTVICPPWRWHASALRVDTADLNGDGKKELVIATMRTESNGMGIEYWKVWVVSENKISNLVEVEDYGVMGFLSSNGKQCRLLVTRWIEGWEPKKEYGLYLAGIWFELSDYKLEPSLHRPAIKRRYLNSLEQLRAQGLQNNKPVIWFRASGTTPIVGPYPFRD